MKTFPLWALLALLALPVAALEPYLVKDIEPATTTAGSNPDHLVTFRGAVLFFADDGVSDRQLDGAEPAPRRFAEAGGVLVYFAYAYSAGTGIVVWRTDGTEAGTFRLTGTSASIGESPVEMEAVGSTVFFTFNGDRGTELWATDGTLAGTRSPASSRPPPWSRSATGFSSPSGDRGSG